MTTGRPWRRICWRDLVTWKRNNDGTQDDDERGMLMHKAAPRGVMRGVMRADGSVAVASASSLTAVDRSYFRPGNVVAPASDPGGQLGVITGVATALDLVRFDDDDLEPVAVAAGVSPTELRRATPLGPGDYVVSGPWLGRVVEMSVDVDVLFDDGALCRVARAEGDGRLEPAVGKDSYLVRHTNCAFFPGQRVVAGGPSVFKASRWLRGYWKPSRVVGTVAKVDVDSVVVCWVASMELGTNKDVVEASAPPAFQRNPRHNLTVFPATAAEGGSWCLGDRCFLLRRCHGDNIPKTAANKMGEKSKRSAARMGVKRRAALRQPAAAATSLSVADTRTTVDVLWQDGARQRGVPSASLVPFDDARNDHDLFPGQRVVVGRAPVARSGVVRSLNAREQTVRVSWLKPAAAKGGGPGPGGAAGQVDHSDDDETVSAYDLARDYYHNFFYGDVVIRRRLTMERATKPINNNATATPKNDLSWVGQIVDLYDDGHVQVEWGDGTMSEVLPHDITVIKQQTIYQMAREMGQWVSDGDTNEQVVIERAQVQDTPPQEPPIIIATENNDDDNSSADGDDDVGDYSTMEAANLNTTRPCRFPRFDIVLSPKDHHFGDSIEQASGVGRKWTKRVHKEWEILKNGLPDSIYMRAFEDRMDLLRAVMVGATGTPYHDGLFFFDLHLPPSFPVEPPQVYYHSFGLQINPNLYPSGTVCLSLLNTFGGHGSELWSPEISSVLQVVVSIQGLVLTAQPYYNAHAAGGHAGTAVGHRNELPYGENAYLLNLQTMLHLLRRPPAGFEELVRDHFHRRSQYVIQACEAYLDGCAAGTLDGDGSSTDESRERPCSAGFRLALANVVPRLVEAFTSIGAERCEPLSRLSNQ